LEKDPTKIIGDDPSNPYERNYGSGYMIIEPGNTSLNHGTFVSGIIAAKKNGVGIDGVADNVLIMNIKAAASGDERDKDVANAIRYAVENGAKVINMSFGKYFSPHKHAVDAAIRYAEQNDVLIVNAAGNEALNTDSVNSYPIPTFDNGEVASNYIEAGTTTISYDANLVWPLSNYGGKTVHLFAPAAEVFAPYPYNNYEYAGGTSSAAPAVAGVAALLKSYFPQLKMFDIKRIILETVKRADMMVHRPGSNTLVPFSSLSVSGGILDAEAAVKKAIELVTR
jgi:subtilisin family serine protease